MLINRPTDKNGKNTVDGQKKHDVKASCEKEADLKNSVENEEDESPKRPVKDAAERSAIAKAFEES